MARRPNDTRQRILEAARELAHAGGLANVTFDRVAERLRLSKQAVIYWFPSKEKLIASIVLPALREESAMVIAAVAEAPDGRSAVERFIRSLAAFHLADLDRFRLMYVSPQSGAKSRRQRVPEEISEQIHPVTTEMYDAIEARLAADPDFSRRTDARRAAVAAHTAVLGLVLMVSLADVTGDSLRHDSTDLLDSLVALMTAGGGMEAKVS